MNTQLRLRKRRTLVALFLSSLFIPLLVYEDERPAVAQVAQSGDFAWPVSGLVTGTVDWHKANENSYAIDIDASDNAPDEIASLEWAVAAHGGKVVWAGTSKDTYKCFLDGQTYGGYGFGTFVTIEHTNGDSPYYTIYAHLDSVSVAAGDNVEVGAVIGAVGDTGCSSNPHLHFGIGHCLARGPTTGKHLYPIGSCSEWGSLRPQSGTEVDAEEPTGNAYAGLDTNVPKSRVTVTDAWTVASNGKPKSTFSCGEKMRYAARVRTGAKRTVLVPFNLIVSQKKPAIAVVQDTDDERLLKGVTTFLFASSAPKAAGTYEVSVISEFVGTPSAQNHGFTVKC